MAAHRRAFVSALLVSSLAALTLTTAVPSASAEDDPPPPEYRWGLTNTLMQDSYGSAWIGDTTQSMSTWGYEFDSDYTIYLARDEREGLQAFFWPQEGGPARQVRLEVTNFVHTNGQDVLVPQVYREVYLQPGSYDRRFVDALVPYSGEILAVDPTTALGWYIEVISARDTTPGDYRAQVTLYEEGSSTPLETAQATAHVWNFTLPEGQYADTTFGNYNSTSGYWETSALAQVAGCQSEDGADPMGSDPECAKAVVKAWYDLLLEHGASGYELPYGLIDDDPRAFAKYVLDPKVTTFTVPVFDGSNGATIQKYHDIIGQWPDIKEKGYFYLLDEIGGCGDCETEADYQAKADEWAAALAPNVNLIKSIWPDPNIMVTAAWNKDAEYQRPVLVNTLQNAGVKTITMLTSLVGNDYDGYAATRDELQAAGGHAWFYPGETPYTTTDLWAWGRPNIGILRRAMYWQLFYTGAEGALDWQTALWRTAEYGALFDPWENNSLTGMGIGDGQYIYPPLSNDPTELIGSLRLKQIADGIDDYDYFRLAERFIGSDFTAQQINQLLIDRGNGPGSVMKFSGGNWYWDETIQQYPDWVLSVRKTIGDALEAANVDAAWAATCSDWTEYLPATTADTGVELRTCDAGLQESREIPKLTGGKDPQGNLNNIETRSGGIWVRGWAADDDAPTTPIQVKVAIGGELGSADAEVFTLDAGLWRSDIPRTYPQFGTDHGFNQTLTTSKRGEQKVYTYAVNAPGTGGAAEKLLAIRTVVIGVDPHGNLNNIETRPGGIWVRGWAADDDAPLTPIQVKVSIGGELGSAGSQTFTLNADLWRSDIPRTYPQFGTDHGFNQTLTTTLRGTQQVYVYAVNVGGGSDKLIAIRTVAIS